MDLNVNNPLEKKPQFSTSRLNLITVLTIFLVGTLLNLYLLPTEPTKNITYSEFLNYIDSDKIENVVISDSKISGNIKAEDGNPSIRFTTALLKEDSLTQRLYSKNIPFTVDFRSPFWSLLFAWILPAVFIFLVWTLMAKKIGGMGTGILPITKSKVKVYIEKEIKTTLNDVAGIEEAKGELMEIVNYLQDPSRYNRLGGRAPKGVLLVGPPGTGKTLLARAVAGEAKVPFFSINGSEFVEMFVGLGAARVRDLFAQARAQAPCILFIDEIDALGKSRTFGQMGTGSNDEKEQTLNQLLAEMDGFDSSEGVIMLAATNRPEILDPALLRAGRFDRQILLSNPDHHGRIQILKVHTKKIKLDSKVDLVHIAAMTPGFSGADLANLVNEAALVATRKDANSVTEKDFSEAIERLVAGLEKKSKVINQHEKVRVAFHELGHATVALGLDVADKVQKISIIPRGMSALGYTLQRPLEDRYLLDENELRNKIAVLLGGRASEKLHFKNVSTGAADDLAKASDIARAMITQFGMSLSLGLESYDVRRAPYLQSVLDVSMKQVSEETSREIDLEVKAILDSCFQKAISVLTLNKEFLDEAAKLLLATETLDENQIASLWEKHKVIHRDGQFNITT